MPPQLKQPLTNLQQELLRVFACTLPEEDLLTLKRFIVQLLAKKVDEQFDDVAERMNYTPEIIEQWAHEHSRTPYRH